MECFVKSCFASTDLCPDGIKKNPVELHKNLISFHHCSDEKIFSFENFVLNAVGRGSFS